METKSPFRSRPLWIAAVLGVATACARTDDDSDYPHAPSVALGQYIVEHVGMCIDCHSPRDEKGDFLEERWLGGSVLPFQPTVPMPWAPAAPQIAGLPSLSDAQAVHFLQTGELPGGRRPRPPMPPYRMSEGDARDVVAYLRSIAPAPQAQAQAQ